MANRKKVEKTRKPTAMPFDERKGDVKSPNHMRWNAPPTPEFPLFNPIPLERVKSSVVGGLKLFAIGVAITIVVMVLLSLLPSNLVPKPSWSWSVEERPLHKNTAFTLKSGDWLEYEVHASGSSGGVRLQVLDGGGHCPGVWLVDEGSAQVVYGGLTAAQKAEPGVYAVCIGNDGVERKPDCGTTLMGGAQNSEGLCGQPMGSNLSFSNVTYPYFQPWMLAVGDGWNWSARRLFTIQPVNESSVVQMQWRTLNRTTYENRSAYTVELTAKPLENQAEWAGAMLGVDGNRSKALAGERIIMLIDEDKRILLYTSNGGNSIRLVNASFLNNTTNNG